MLPTAFAQHVKACPVVRPDFKSGEGSISILCGFDSHCLPPNKGTTLTPEE
jgi:hypothetical protein